MAETQPGANTVHITRTIEVPIRAAHRGQRAVQLGPEVYLEGHEGFSMRFRACTERQRFRRSIPAPMKVGGASVTFGRG